MTMNSGPLELPMPADPDPCPGIDWNARYMEGVYTEHQDSQDRLNADRTYGTGNPAEGGPSGMEFTYSQPDIAAVRVLCHALNNTVPGPDVEHQMRKLRLFMAGFDMTHEPFFARGVKQCADYCLQQFPLLGPVSLDPSNFAQNLQSLGAWVNANPGCGIPYVIPRAFGSALYCYAAYHKVARALGVPVDPNWMTQALAILDRAAFPTTGQLFTGPDPAHQLDGPGEYTFHWSFVALGAMACTKRLHRPPPTWIAPHLNALVTMPSMDYYSQPSLPGFTTTNSQGGLIPCTGIGQQPDPNFGWWSTVCLAYAQESGDPAFKKMATLWGPQTWDGHDEPTRKLTMVLRGAQA